MHRKSFLYFLGMAGIGAGLKPLSFPQKYVLLTVKGNLSAADAGICLPHEHLFSSFGLDAIELNDEEREDIFLKVRDYCLYLKTLGCTTIMDCTAAGFGRDPLLLKRISEASGMHILTNTGYYGAANDRYVPPHAFNETAAELAERWWMECRQGMEDTGIRPGFIKIGVDDYPLSAIDRKLVEAACLLHRKSGLTIACHTVSKDGKTITEILDILKTSDTPTDAFIWVHAHQCTDEAFLVNTARQGLWIELDGIQKNTADRHLQLLVLMKSAGLLHRVLLSHDGNSYKIRMNASRPYHALFTRLLPALRKEGFSEQELGLLTRTNPFNAFSIRL